MLESKPEHEQAPDPTLPDDPGPAIFKITPSAEMRPVDVTAEPPIDPLADTNPSLAMPAVTLDADDEGESLPMWRHAAGLALALLAVATMIAAGLIYVMPLVRAGQTPAPAPETSLPQPSNTPAAVAAAPMGDEQVAPLPFGPTLAPDDIAALLATPPQLVAADAEAIMREDSAFTIVPERSRGTVTTYTIQSGDTVESIATRFGLEKDTIAWSNDRNVVFSLRPGNNLYILPVDGVYYRPLVDETIQSIADKFNVDPYTIINSEFNELYGAAPESTVRSGHYVVVPGGTSTYNDWTYNPIVERTGGGGGGSSDGGYISFAPGQPGSCGSQPNPGGTGYFIQPLASYSWVRGFTGYHTGVDLDAPAGAAVFAASPGRVIYRGWNDWGYGYLVVLAHGPFTSFYGHLSSINVGCGQMVGAGQVIGGVGTSGNSSGPHLHFEIRYNDIATDPLLYVGF